MCGIIAYLNFNVPRERRFILEVLFNGLRRMAYRGYSSAGISIDSSPHLNGENIAPAPLVFRLNASIDSLIKYVYQETADTDLTLEESLSIHAGIAHIRWTMFGEPSPGNSHPQASDSENEFLVVHNGIITNHMVLKEILVRHGFTFESDTDTEVIPKLAKFVFDTANIQGDKSKSITFSQVVIEVTRLLEGAFALVFKSRHYPNELVACKRGTPMILGENEFLVEGATTRGSSNGPKSLSKEFFLSSEYNALLEHTRKFLVLQDDEVVHLKDGRASIFKLENGGTQKKQASLEKRSFSLLETQVLLKKINEHTEFLKTAMQGWISIYGGSRKSSNKMEIVRGLEDHLNAIRRSRRIIVIGRGANYNNAALAARPIVEELTGIPTTVELASDLVDRQGPLYEEDTAIFVSQSGETADTLLALEYALDSGALCVGITNVIGSTIAKKTHCGIHTNDGSWEIGESNTKAYISQIVLIALLALKIGADDLSNHARRKAIIDDLLCLPSKVKEVLKLDQDMKELAKLLIVEQPVLIIGSGYNYATAIEGALLLKEVSHMHRNGILAGEMKYDALASADDNLPILVIATHDACLSKQRLFIQRLHARKGRLIVMCTKGDAASISCGGSCCHIIEVSQVEDYLQPILNVVPLQLLAYHLTVLRGYQPRNLARNVMIQRDFQMMTDRRRYISSVEFPHDAWMS